MMVETIDLASFDVRINPIGEKHRMFRTESLRTKCVDVPESSLHIRCQDERPHTPGLKGGRSVETAMRKR